MELGGTIGGSAAKCLVDLKGQKVKKELLQSLLQRRSDFNYCFNAGHTALLPLIRKEDVAHIAAMADSIDDEVTLDMEDSPARGFTWAIADLLQQIELSVVAQAFLGKPSETKTRARELILCEALTNHHSTGALELAADLLMRGWDKAATTIYFIAKFDKSAALSWTSYGNAHAERLISIVLQETDNSPWALKALTYLCQARQDVAAVVQERALELAGLQKAALAFAACPKLTEPVFRALGELAQMSEDQRKKEPTFLLKQMELDWRGREDLFVRLLRLRDAFLAVCLMESIHDEDRVGELMAIGDLEIGPTEWWLHWLVDVQDPKTHWWFQYRISLLFAGHLKPAARKAFLTEFNMRDSRHRKVLARTILLARDDLTTDDFSEDAVSFLLSDLSRKGSCDGFREHLLGRTATETFVVERLLPLLSEAKGDFEGNLLQVLREAGSRHGRRYVAGS
jgi:hypothetical protein